MNKLYKRLLAIIAILVMGMGTLLAQSARDDYENSYLTIESLSDNDTIKFKKFEGVTSEQLTWVAYSTDGTTWTTMQIDNTEQNITVVLNQGEKLYFKGWGKQYATYNYDYYSHFLSTADFVMYGNIMSLLYGDDFASQTAFPENSDNNFNGLFIIAFILCRLRMWCSQLLRSLHVVILICLVDARISLQLLNCQPLLWQKVAIVICSTNAVG